MVDALVFSTVDHVLFWGMLGISAIIGIYFGFCSSDKQNTPKDYLMGGKSMSVFPISMSLIASHISGVALLGIPSEMYTYGSQYMMNFLTMFIIVPLVIYIYLPVFYSLQLTSSFEYLEKRFNRAVRVATSFLFALNLIMFTPIAIYMPAIAFGQVTGVSIHKVSFLVTAVCVFYTTLGGMRAVVWTDTLQSLITFIALVIVLGIGVVSIGGPLELWRKADEGGRIILFNMNLSPISDRSFLGVMLGLMTMYLSELAAGHQYVQRYLSLPTIQHARRSVWVFAIGISAVKIFACTIGFLIYAHFSDCDPLKTGEVKKPDQLVPHYVLAISSALPGLSGLFVAGVFSAALSTISTNLNTLSGTIYEDFLKPFMPNASELKASNIMKVTVVLLGTLSLGLVFVVEHLGSAMQLATSVLGITAGTILGLFSLGMLVPRANSKGALCGAVVSLLLVGWIVMGAQMNVLAGKLKYPYLPTSTEGCDPPHNQTLLPSVTPEHSNEDVFWLFRIGFMFYGFIGAVLVFVVGVPVSLFTGPPRPYSLLLLSPPVQRWALAPPQHECLSSGEPLVDMKPHEIHSSE